MKLLRLSECVVVCRLTLIPRRTQWRVEELLPRALGSSGAKWEVPLNLELY